MILVTGSTGLVGRALVERLEWAGHPFRVARRQPDGDGAGGTAVGEIGPATDWSSALRGCSAVVHLAARVHVMRETAVDPLAAFRAVNVAGTMQLARQALEAGVERFVFISTVKVLGESSGDGSLSERDPPAPCDPYSISKWEAEIALGRLAAGTDLGVTVLRPPLVYGADAGGNFASLVSALRRGLPLPLASVHNRRSLIYAGNLADAIVACLRHPVVPRGTFLVSDGEDVSTPELLRRCARAMGTSARLLPCPVALLRAAAVVTGRGAAFDRLTGSLAVDSSAFRAALGWQPPFTLNEGLAHSLSSSARRRAR